ncbi:acetyl-CoA carboxylase [Aquincola sp. S2]|uniref:Acetyl-CoA carboxylase n=1 Tax=Pseudaquabacterium terrae TaxID=2732868 RepID=A0ABX2EGH7_9BURK|nr:biotin/lipoyl-containing protein [Aquabacterium terrae]NRF67704.1 acetyl-CoA carboxylase [Aquabacterium terrae]
MRPDQIQQIAGWLAATDIALLELRGPGHTLLLRHDGAAVERITPGDEAPIDVPAAPDPLTVSAPSLGVFLHRHPLRAEALAAAGSAVQAGQVLGLLQIGPLLLPVAAPADACVIELLADDGAVVGYGTPLMVLQLDTPA